MPAHFCEKCGRPKAVVGITDAKNNGDKLTGAYHDTVFEIINGQIWACLKCNRGAIIDETKKEK